MINKLDLVSIISKYFLNGKNEAVKWDIVDNKLTIKFKAPDKSMIGSVTCDNFDLEDSSIGISNTTQFIVADNQFTLNYALADTMIIPPAGEFAGVDEYNIVASLDNESINSIVRAKSSLAETDTVVFKPFTNADGDQQLEMVFGGNIEYSNKVSFYIPDIQFHNIPDNFKLNYDSNMIKEVMYCNKDVANCTMKISLDGIMNLNFDNGSIKSEYYIIAKDY